MPPVGEPVRPSGWPGPLPQGERLLWTGGPDFKVFARRVLRLRVLALYFAILGAAAFGVALARGQGLETALRGGLGVLPPAALVLALALGFAALVARTTRYAITDRRVVMRFGIAISVTLNLPFAAIRAADAKVLRDGTGEITLDLTDPRRVLYATLWPHARPRRFARPQPALRGLGDAAAPARILADALRRADGESRRAALHVVASVPGVATA